MSKLALLSDIHGNLPALEAVVADLGNRGVSRVINLGDHVSGPLWPKETLDFLMAVDWLQVAGNHDRSLARGDPRNLGPSDAYARSRVDKAGLAWLAGLPAVLELEGGILACHGRPGDDQAYLLESPSAGRTRLATEPEIRSRLGAHAPRVVVCGHTHLPRCVRLGDGTILVNPGSVGLQGYVDDGANAHVVENGSPHARYAIIDLDWDKPRFAVEFVALEYDWEAAAEKAKESKRRDWIQALATGFVS